MKPAWSDSDAEASGLILGEAEWDRLRLGAMGAAAILSLYCAFWDRGSVGLLAASLWSLILVVSLALGRFFAPVLFEIFAQMHYRERFAMFLLHLGAMCMPLLVGLKGWDHALAALLMFSAVLAIGPVQAGRVYAATGLLVLNGIASPPLAPFWITALWLLVLLVAIRAESLHTRLEDHGTGPGIPLRTAARESLWAFLVPWGAGVLCWGVLAWLLSGHTRELNFEGSPRHGISPMGPVSFSDVYWDAIMLVLLIVATLGTIAWIDRKLRSRRRGPQEIGDGDMKAWERRSARDLPAEEASDFVEADDPRGRILRAFRVFSTSLGRTGWARGEAETAQAYLLRLAERLLGGEELPADLAPLFARACYSSLDVSEQQATQFRTDLEALEPRLQDVLDRAKASRRAQDEASEQGAE